MAMSKASTLSILLVLAVCVTYCVGKPEDYVTSEGAWAILMDANAELGPKRVFSLIEIVNDDINLRKKELGPGLVVQEAYYYATDDSCDWLVMQEFNKFYVQADLFSKSIKNFLIHYYEKQIKNCEEIAKLGLLLFQKKKPALWKQFKEFFNAIKSDNKLYADLGRGGSGMNKETINLLGNVLEKKNPGVDADYQSDAIRKIRNICEDFRKTLWHSDQFLLLDSLTIVKELSPGIKRQGDLPKHARYLQLCKRAKETILPREAQRIKLLTEHQDELKKLQKEYQARIGRLGQGYRAQIDDLMYPNKNQIKRRAESKLSV